jgi:hypothetical protein
VPTSLKRIRSTGATVFLHTCDAEGCEADASFGFGVNMRLAMNRLEAVDPIGAKRHLGEWFCGKHRTMGGQS